MAQASNPSIRGREAQRQEHPQRRSRVMKDYMQFLSHTHTSQDPRQGRAGHTVGVFPPQLTGDNYIHRHPLRAGSQVILDPVR